MSPCHRLRFVTVCELGVGISARRVEQKIPRRSVGSYGDQRLADQRSHRINDLCGVELVVRSDRLSRFEREWTNEDRKPLEHHPFDVGQEIVAPVEGSIQSLMARQ